MELILKKRETTEPVVLVFEDVENGVKVKKTAKIIPGETLELPDEIGYTILGNPSYRAVLEIANKRVEDTYQKKVLKTESTKGML